MDPRTTAHRTERHVPVFCSSKEGLNVNDPMNSQFEQRLQPGIAVPLTAKNPRMHLEQCSLPYTMTNVRAGINDSFDVSVNSGIIGYNPDLASMYSPAHVPAVILATAQQSYGGFVGVDDVFVEVPFATLAATDGSVAEITAAINAITFATVGLTAFLLDHTSTTHGISFFHVDDGEGGSTEVGGPALKAETRETWLSASGTFGNVSASTRLCSAPHHGGTGRGHYANGLVIGTPMITTIDNVPYPFVSHESKYYLSLAFLTGNNSGVIASPFRAVDFWSPFTAFQSIKVPKGLYSMTDSMDESKRASGHHTTTDVALAIKAAMATSVPGSVVRTSQYYFTLLTSFSTDSYPVHIEPDLSINRVKMKLHNGIVINASTSSSIIGKLLGFTGIHEGAIDAGPAAGSITATSVAGIDDGTRALYVHCSIATGGYSTNGQQGSSCIGSFPITHAPGSVISYAPSADPFRSQCPVAGALVDHLVWSLRDENGALVDLQGEDWQALGVLAWDEDETLA